MKKGCNLLLCIVAVHHCTLFLVHGFSTTSSITTTPFTRSNLFPSSTTTRLVNNNNNNFNRLVSLQVASESSSSNSSKVDNADESSKATTPKKKYQKKTIKELRAEGGPLTFNTPIGALNPFAIYYGLMSIFLGIPWFFALKSFQLLHWLSRGKFDPKRKIPVLMNHLWGVTLMRLSRSYVEMENLDILKQFYKQGRAAMFVANHNSWMDIPFLGATIGWRNYKLVSKKELGKVPILGTAIVAGGNIMVDRLDRRSQLKTLKDGMAYLKNGVHLCTFPEGTRSRTGRVGKFKNGAFKMAHKTESPVVPISIVASGKVMPPGWMFAMKPSYKNAKVVVHEPIESKGKTEEELANAVRDAMIAGLPEDQRPLK